MEIVKRMERAKVVKDEIVEQNMHFLAVYIETKNSCLVLLSEKEDKLGTLAIAVPVPKDVLGSPTSSILLGDRNAVTARMFAEFVSARKGKIALVSVYLETFSEMQVQSVFRRLIEKVVNVAAEAGKEGVTA